MKKQIFVLLVSSILIVSSVFAFDQTATKTPYDGIEVDLNKSIVEIYTIGSAWMAFRHGDVWTKGVATYGHNGTGFVVRGGYIVTAAHVVEPSIIDDEKNGIYAFPISLISREIIVSEFPGQGGLPAKVVYLNYESDDVILEIIGEGTSNLIPLPYELAWTKDVKAGDSIFTLVRKRTSKGEKIRGKTEIRHGKILAETAILLPEHQKHLPWFSGTDVTIDLSVFPGDSGAPLFAFEDGKPVIIGIVRAGYSDKSSGRLIYTYAVRIDVVRVIIMTR